MTTAAPASLVLFALLSFHAPAAAQEEAAADAAAAATDESPAQKASTFAALKLRALGPAITSGRIGDLAVDPTDKAHWYVAVASGGVWETKNAGTTFTPIFDGQTSYSIGCVAIDPTDPQTVWVGTGENNSQRSVSYGDGVYKSTDGGGKWQKVGLGESEHIGMIAIDPRCGDRVFVAAQGPLWKEGGDRGLYLTEDGGATWRSVLTVDEHTGCSEVLFDPGDPDVMYASTYQRRRHVFTLVNGGPGSAVWRSTDGGATWQKTTRGLPGGDLGRVGMAVAPSQPGLVYAIVQAAAGGGVYRSEDHGRSWSKRSSYVSGSPQYYQELFVDPVDPDRVWSMDVFLQLSEDGGKTWRGINESNKHVDNHAFWIDPDDTRHVLCGCDGGIYESFDRGQSWRFFANLPVTQFYRVSVDEDFPFYHVYGGTQDNFSMGGPARTRSGDITNREWFMTRGGDGFETVVDPEDPDVVYSESQHGGLVRYDRGTGETTDIKPRERDGEALIWNWNAPLMISPHAHTRLYFAANVLFRSDDRGDSWTAVSGDLSKQLDRNAMPVMGRVQGVDAIDKNRSTSVYGNCVALTESPAAEGTLYVGTDDGRIQVTRDGGGSWTAFDAFPGIPELTYVSALCASLHDAATVYAAFDNHKRGDFAPYLLRSTDAGQSWTSITGDLPARGSVHCVVEDHVDKDLLFCGTEFGVFFTQDGGAHWLQLKGGMPPIAVRDLDIQRREDDLVLATFGRGFYVLDDYSVLRHADAESLAQEAAMFPPRDAWLYVESNPLGRSGKAFQGDAFYTAESAPVGAVLRFWVQDVPKTLKQQREAVEATARKQGDDVVWPSWDELRREDRQDKPQHVVTIRDQGGRTVRRIVQSAKTGLQQVVWDLRWGGAGSGRFARGPMAVPGSYTADLALLSGGPGEANVQPLAGPVSFEVRRLPGSKFPAEDPAAVLAFQRDVLDLSRRVRATDAKLDEVVERIETLTDVLPALPTAELAWLQEARALQQQALDLRLVMDGDPVISRSYEAQPPSLQSRARTAMASFGSTSAPTQTQRDQHALSKQLLAPVIEQLEQLDGAVKALEERVEQAGGPVPAGRLPGGGE